MDRRTLASAAVAPLLCVAAALPQGACRKAAQTLRRKASATTASVVAIAGEKKLMEEFAMKAITRVFALLAALVFLGSALTACQKQGVSGGEAAPPSSESAPISQLGSQDHELDQPGSQEEDDLAIVERRGDRFLAGDGNVYAAGGVEVSFRAGVTPERAREVIAEHGCEVAYQTVVADPGSGEWVYACVRVPEGGETAFVLEFRSVEEVECAEYEGVAYLSEGESVLEAGEAGRKPGRSLDFGEYYLDASGFNDAFDLVRCNGDVTVAVLDTAEGGATTAPGRTDAATTDLVGCCIHLPWVNVS